MYSKAKILGHPIHPMLVAYPIALYTATAVCYIIYVFHNDPFFFKAAVASNVAGVVMAAAAALPGFLDWAIGIPNGSAAKQHGLIHMGLNVAALVIFVVNAIIHTGNWTTPSGTASAIILSVLGVLCTVGAGFFGWIMIQTDHVGVEMPARPEPYEPRPTLRTG
jgi:uncharacterized membrane protein